MSDDEERKARFERWLQSHSKGGPSMRKQRISVCSVDSGLSLKVLELGWQDQNRKINVVIKHKMVWNGEDWRQRKNLEGNDCRSLWEGWLQVLPCPCVCLSVCFNSFLILGPFWHTESVISKMVFLPQGWCVPSIFVFLHMAEGYNKLCSVTVAHCTRNNWSVCILKGDPSDFLINHNFHPIQTLSKNV